ncbi:MAG: DegT/DnrJ/EryC1/StrS family aminotransferase [Elusimicrobia bacterium]|nr:DegT/DnrJ/EryC1/StrS family aminotransferase [Elusimicrobiota bacterium]
MERTQAPETVRAFKPGLNAADAAAVRAAFESGWIGTGVYARLVEQRVARAAGTPHASAVSSGTAAVHLALELAGVKGGEVITTPLTSPATSRAIRYAGAEPVFCDVEEDTGNLDPRRVAERLGRRARAIVAVHFNGHPCDMDALRRLARERGVPLIEDACASAPLGSAYKGKPLGGLGDFGCFSFGRKVLTTLDGGAVLVRREADAARLKRLRNLGQDDGAGPDERPRDLSERGWPYRLNDLAAAVGLAQFERWAETRARLEALDQTYREAIGGRLSLLARRAYASVVPACFAVRVGGGRKRALRAHLRAQGVRTDDWLRPNHLLAPFKAHRRALPVAEGLASELLYLPFYPGLTDSEAGRVANALRAFKDRA